MTREKIEKLRERYARAAEAGTGGPLPELASGTLDPPPPITPDRIVPQLPDPAAAPPA